METNNLEIKRYEDHLILRNFSKSTIRSYKSTLVKYFTHCNKLNITQNLDQELIRNYLVYLYKKGLSYV
jgi:site-specific recombinase XerD